jgi:hypothetical protein
VAGFKELWELHKPQLDGQGWLILGLGLVVASISAFVAIWALMKVLERFSAWPFVIYRGVLGAVLLIGVATGWLREAHVFLFGAPRLRYRYAQRYAVSKSVASLAIDRGLIAMQKSRPAFEQPRLWLCEARFDAIANWRAGLRGPSLSK